MATGDLITGAGILVFMAVVWWLSFTFFLRWKDVKDAMHGYVTRLTTPNLNIARNWLTPHFSFVGRMTRKQYIWAQIIAGVGLGITLLIGSRLLDSWSSVFQGIGILLIIVALAVVCWLILAASAKRMRDTGVTVWWVLALLVPALNLAAYAFLFLVPTDEFAGRGL